KLIADPRLLQERRDKAYQLYQSGDSVRAAWWCRMILLQEPRQAEASYLLGVIAHDLGQMELAAELTNTAVQAAPDNAVYRNALGEVFLEAGKQAEALSCFQKALALSP